MESKVVITVDGACDITDEILNKYNLHTTPFAININGKSYYADTEITKDDIYREFKEYGTITKTAAIGVGEYTDYFKTWIDKGYDIVHITLSSNISCSFQNCLAAQIELGDKLHVIDSGSLSSGLLLLAIEGYKLAQSGIGADEIADKLRKLQKRIRVTFIVEKLNFLSAGGRCSKITAMGANLLDIKPSIILADGKMQTGKKYRGKWDKVVLNFLNDTLKNYNISEEMFFVSHSDVNSQLIKKVVDEVKLTTKVKEIYVTETKAVISCHCGPNSIGFLFLEKS